MNLIGMISLRRVYKFRVRRCLADAGGADKNLTVYLRAQNEVNNKNIKVSPENMSPMEHTISLD